MKAFDTVPHKQMLEKKKGYGINNITVKWIQGFLKDWRQKVVINGTHSEWSDVTSGIPQGGVLCPLLFILYISDLPRVVESLMLLFADDTKLYTQINSEIDHIQMQQDINSMYTWSKEWLLKFHPGKCKVLRLGKKDEEDFQHSLGSQSFGIY